MDETEAAANNGLVFVLLPTTASIVKLAEHPFGISRLCIVLVEFGDVSAVFQVAPEQIPLLNAFGERIVF
jgi:hypothetical protein